MRTITKFVLQSFLVVFGTWAKRSRERWSTASAPGQPAEIRGDATVKFTRIG